MIRLHVSVWFTDAVTDMFLKIEQNVQSLFCHSLVIKHGSISGAWAKGLCFESIKFL